VVDDNSGKTGNRRHGLRTSLVERAVERLSAERGAGGSKNAVPVPPALSEAAPPQPPASSSEDVHVADGAAAPGLEASSGSVIVESPQPPAAPDDPGPAGEPAEVASNGRRRRSRVVKIDRANMAARGIVTPEAKRNRTVEEFRLIKRMVLSQRWDVQGAPGNTIVVTSALPAEGKTTTAINLAMSITAEEDLRVVLVDADFIKPDALRQLGVSADKGLIDVLQDPSIDIGDVMLRTDIDKLSLIPAGQLHDRCTEFLASARMDSLVKELSSRYEDRILIFDSPPILATSESVALTSHMGQVVFVVQAGRTKRESVDSALELIGERAQLSLILNRTTGGFGKTDFGAYYSSYYYGYGGKGDQPGQAAG
jgi:receptor protein-tyrosine kinase